MEETDVVSIETPDCVSPCSISSDEDQKCSVSLDEDQQNSISSPELSEKDDGGERFRLESELMEMLERHEVAIQENPPEDANYESEDLAEFDEDARIEIYTFCTTVLDRSRNFQTGLYVMATNEDIEKWASKSDHKLQKIISGGMRQITRPVHHTDDHKEAQHKMETITIAQALHNIQFAMEIQIRAMFGEMYDQLTAEQLGFVNTPDRVVVYSSASLNEFNEAETPDEAELPVTVPKISKLMELGDIDAVIRLLRFEMQPEFIRAESDKLATRVTGILQKLGHELIVAKHPQSHRHKVKKLPVKQK